MWLVRQYLLARLPDYPLDVFSEIVSACQVAKLLSTFKRCLHKRENNEYLLLPLSMAVEGDRKSYIETLLFSAVTNFS